MSLGSLAGHAFASPHSPIGQAECDRCREWYPRTELTWQYYWRGASLENSGLLVCRRKCLDEPNQQYRTLILPGDPQPFANPRPSPNTTPPAYAGLQPPTDPANMGFTGVPVGVPTPGLYPGYNGTMINDVAAITGIPTPPDIIDRSVTLRAAAVSQVVMAANPTRTWLLLFGPMAAPISFALGPQAFFGSTMVLGVGPGQAWFSATSQGLGTVYQGEISAVALNPGTVLWAFESSGTGTANIWLDERGNAMEDENGYLMWSP